MNFAAASVWPGVSEGPGSPLQGNGRGAAPSYTKEIFDRKSDNTLEWFYKKNPEVA
ncbi:MAG: hypothetical protein GY757_02720 [bacterium]|nr:hypothetical protein [bacterium]